MTDFLDRDQALIEKDTDTGELKATAYFEDFLYQIVNASGGETSNPGQDAFDLTIFDVEIARLMSRFISLKNRVEHNERMIPDVNLNGIKYRLNRLETWHEDTKSATYTMRPNDWITFTGGKVVLPSGSKGDRFRITKAIRKIPFVGSLWWKNKVYTGGYLPGGKGSDLDFEYSKDNEAWVIV